MSDRFAVVIAEVRIPSGVDYTETLTEAVGAIEGGVQSTGLTCRLETDTIVRVAGGRWGNRK